MKELKLLQMSLQLDKFINQLEYEGQTLLENKGTDYQVVKNKGWNSLITICEQRNIDF